MLPALQHLMVPTHRNWRPKVLGYVEHLVPDFDEEDMRRMFRLSSAATDLLIRIITLAVKNRQRTYARGRPAVSIEKQVCY